MGGLIDAWFAGLEFTIVYTWRSVEGKFERFSYRIQLLGSVVRNTKGLLQFWSVRLMTLQATIARRIMLSCPLTNQIPQHLICKSMKTTKGSTRSPATKIWCTHIPSDIHEPPSSSH
jgi:hypothetical protein